MSQINDALRRAGQNLRAGASTPPMPPPMPASAPPPPPMPPPPSPMLPLPPMGLPGMEEGEAAQHKSSVKQIALAGALLLCVVIAATFTFLEKRARLEANVAPSKEAGAKKTLPVEVVKKSLAARQTNAAPTNVATPNAPLAAGVPMTVAAPVTPPRPVEPVKFPPLRLQSIFYRPSSPSVMINNKTLYVDDTIQGVLVAEIQPASVTLVLSGQTNVLTLR